MTDHLDPRAVTWRQTAIEASVTLRTQAAADFRRWAVEELLLGNDDLSADCTRMADRLERLFGTNGGAP